MYAPELDAVVDQAYERLHSQARGAGAFLGDQIVQWIQDVYPVDRPQDALKSPRSDPMILLPWYAERSLHPEMDLDFQSDLVYSTVSGYYYIRLMDNLMDGHGDESLSLLPALSFFHTQFHSPYQRYFKHEHPFWDYFSRTWLHSAEVTMRDAQLAEIDRSTFEQVSAQKSSAAKIPLAAVFYRYKQTHRIETWSLFVDQFGCWHQMWNDIFSWVKDTRGETQTYFLSEANRRKRDHEPIIDWVIREGFDWGMGLLDEWMEEMYSTAVVLESPQLLDYLDERKRLLSEQKSQSIQSLDQIGKLLFGFKRALNSQES